MSRKFVNSLLFLWASLVSAMTSLVAFYLILAKELNQGGTRLRDRARIFLAVKERVLTFYDILSPLYDSVNPYFYTRSMRNEILHLMDGDQCTIVLDAGCGTGYTTEGILNRPNTKKVIGVDVNSKQLERARKRFEKAGSRFSYSMCDVENLSFKDEVFDAVVSVGAVEYFSDPRKAVREMSRVSKFGGKIIVGGPVLDWFHRIFLNRIFYTPSTDELKRLFNQAGLKHVGAILTGVETYWGTEEYVVVVAGTK